VAFHVGNILQKLDVAGRTEAVVRAKERGIIP
jgi:DNA-binding NarL/FixJ family response regulator